MTKNPRREHSAPDQQPPVTPNPQAAAGDQPAAEPVAAAPAASQPEPAAAEAPDELALAKKQAEEYLNSWKRSVADYQNFKKQQEAERKQWVAFANNEMLRELLPAMDDLDKAVREVGDEIRKTPWFDGLALIKKKMETSFESIGVTEIQAKGTKFDPSIHQAVLQDQVEGVEPGMVTEVMQKGFMLNGRLLRAAMVKVSQ
ncbi:nucleotide exchange factor GrpE [Candidatus Wirthbacteria bacterium CG2_30_54_11]|uniref:Protein GrpE n=1 Tax=Candidatus Wirthbacteria bacterium CG2_30_54_11 TaxID=1817892 RepID=A0A1J5ID12_9BACT|nr:MAG: nucleotide exchange factor GrpE [Candidatus Wirthbacteria bacterium CG2_30_54_11]